jgi:hypothetical protein
MMLAELGFGLDLDSRAATGSTSYLAYVSPQSGRAVSRGAGEAWRNRLLPLPAFLGSEDMHVPAEDLDAGFRLTGYFVHDPTATLRVCTHKSGRPADPDAGRCDQANLLPSIAIWSNACRLKRLTRL